MAQKPPVGLMPRSVAIKLQIDPVTRIKALREAMVRYALANQQIPPEWITECLELEIIISN